MAAQRPDEVCRSDRAALFASDAGKPQPSFAALTDTLSLTGRGDERYHRKNLDPISAPSAAHTAIASVYQVVTNATESVGQYIA